ncbi:MAG: tetratricopeptide repeat protein [Treponema sp.]|nr:tetratricopeptide repeat protein [Treponema sp.]
MLNETAEKLNNQAIMLASHGQYTEAIACFVRAITIEKDNSLLWFNLGVTYRDSGNLESARDALEKAYDINFVDEEIVEALSLVCYSLGDFDSALMYCTEGLDFNPDNPHLWNTMGVVFFNQSKYDEASEAFEVAVSLNPYYYDALYNLKDTYHELGNKNGEAECQNRLREIKKNRTEDF